jgi:hypothetical protein
VDAILPNGRTGAKIPVCHLASAGVVSIGVIPHEARVSTDGAIPVWVMLNPEFGPTKFIQNKFSSPCSPPTSPRYRLSNACDLLTKVTFALYTTYSLVCDLFRSLHCPTVARHPCQISSAIPWTETSNLTLVARLALNFSPTSRYLSPHLLHWSEIEKYRKYGVCILLCQSHLMRRLTIM